MPVEQGEAGARAWPLQVGCERRQAGFPLRCGKYLSWDGGVEAEGARRKATVPGELWEWSTWSCNSADAAAVGESGGMGTYKGGTGTGRERRTRGQGGKRYVRDRRGTRKGEHDGKKGRREKRRGRSDIRLMQEQREKEKAQGKAEGERAKGGKEHKVYRKSGGPSLSATDSRNGS